MDNYTLALLDNGILFGDRTHTHTQSRKVTVGTQAMSLYNHHGDKKK